MKQFKIMVVGAGSIGARHIRNLLSLGQKNIVVVEPSLLRQKQLRKDISSKLIFLDTEKKAYQTFSPEVVFICNPTAAHISSLRLALTNNAHVFVEKPLSYSSKGTKELESLALKKNKVVLVGCNFRFHTGWKKLRECIQQKKFGAPLYVRVVLGYHLPSARPHAPYKKVYAASLRGGGVALDTGSHIIDYLSVLVGEISSATIAKSRLHSLGIPSDEVTHFFFRHKGGIDSVITGDYVRTKAAHTIEVVTTRGTLLLDMRANRLTFEDDKKPTIVFQGSLDMNQMFIDELKHFFDTITKHTSPLQSLSAAIAVLKILERAKNI